MTVESADRVVSRPYRDESDWQGIRALLIRARGRVAHGEVWDVRHWDGWRYHRSRPRTDAQMAACIGVWETQEGRIVGAVHPESGGDAFIELDPSFRRLEAEMIAWAEDHLPSPRDARGMSRLQFWVADDAETRRGLLSDFGYQIGEPGGWLRCLRFGTPDEPESPDEIGSGPLSTETELPEPYRLRTTQPSESDCARMAALLNSAFGVSTHTAREIHNFVDRSPSFEHELNLVAVAPDESFAATVGVTYDAENRHGIIEPVCTHPAHRLSGLARCLLNEGLRRLAARGARTASLDAGEGEAANALYIACGFVEGHHFRPWRREL